jgi:serine/threonine protein kinase
MEQALICLRSIELFAEYHSKNFFHGDIKPENILFNYKFITSDAGTLLDLGIDQPIDNPRFIVTSFTFGFASKQHVEAVNNQTPLTKS